MAELPGLWSLTPVGALIGVLVLFFYMLATGRIIPKSSHELIVAASNKRGDEWKETAMEGRKVITAQTAQIGDLIEANKTAAQFFGTVGSGSTKPAGGDHVAT